MSHLFHFLLSCFFSLSLAAQPLVKNEIPVMGTGNTYALVIGVAKYLDPDIPQLQYANRDAEIFAEFLQSKGGGSVSKENIRLLVDSAATTGAVYDAVYWLKKTCQKDDIVYFYFSGHGDLENITMYNNGFLICYDSPPNNYVKLALSIDYLNDIANTLSLEKQANVILITDACHSGKITEKRFKGNFLAGNQLRKRKHNEIRITSSSGEELSNEKADWDGGRGVFSYYLVNGLQGLADKDKKGLVTVEDIKNYLDYSLENDQVLKMENIKQTPVVMGNGSFVLTKKVDTSVMLAAKKLVSTDQLRQRELITALAENKTPQTAEAYFLNLLQKGIPETITTSSNLDELPKNEIAFKLIDDLKTYFGDDASHQKLNELKEMLVSDKDALAALNGRLAAVFDAAGQEVITQYLKGDAAELEKRRYYNAAYSGYDVYPKMYAVALKLTEPDNKYYYNALQVKLYYFTGVNLRLKLPLTPIPEQKALIEKALAEQKKALALEEYAAYIYNELGILYNYKNNLARAEKYFRIASQRAPSWAIPLLNLADIYADNGKLELAKIYADSSFMLQPGLQDIYVTYGNIHEKKLKMLQAEEAYQHSIKINDRHFIPYERLGYVYMNNLAFAMADSMFYEAQQRKKGFHFSKGVNTRNMKLPKAVNVKISCSIDSANTDKSDIMGQFALGYTAYRDYDLAKAERAFKRVIALDNKNPLAFHYLGRTLYDQQRWQEAEQVLKMAINNYLPDTLWTKYYDSLFEKSNLSTAFIIDPCSDSCYRLGYYNFTEDYELMARLYENWNHYSESETYYRKLIAANPNDVNGYLKLVKLFEKTGRYNDAENYLLEYNIRSNYSIDEELDAFYQRVTQQFPENADWLLKAGNFQYAIARSSPDEFLNDTKWVDPVLKEIIYKYPDRQQKWKMAPPPVIRLIPYGTRIPAIKSAKPVFTPFTDGINYLKQAANFLQADETVFAAINTKLGDLYNWQGLPDSALNFYEAAIELNPTDAGLRIKLVETYARNYRFTDGLAQLDSLRNRNEINYDKQLLMANWFMQDNRFAEAEKLLQEAAGIKPVFDTGLLALKAKLAMLHAKPLQAMEFFNSLYLLNNNNNINLYCMARLQAKSGNKQQAYLWLDKAIKAGFNYVYVLKYDPALKNLQHELKWKKMVLSIQEKDYFSIDQQQDAANF